MTETPELPRPVLVLVALVQGLLLLLLHESVEKNGWLSLDANIAWRYALFTATIVGPSLLLLSLDTTNARRLLRLVVPFTALVAALGYYVGAQQLPKDDFQPLFYSLYGLTMAIACFKALLYIQQYATGAPATYAQLYQFSWRNFLTQGSALAFMSLFWGILMLGAALFKVINIHFLFDLFTDRWFLYPALGMAHGFGIVIFRSQQKIFDLATRVNEALMKFLLVMLVLLSIGFLCALPFTGLAPLWETRTGSALILWLQALVLFVLNGVYQDGETRPYPLSLHRFIYVGVALLPVYSAISGYGLYLRIEQYGWTLERCWAVVAWTLFALFSVGYLVGICRLRDRWVTRLGWVNVGMGLVLLAVLLLTNSPLLDFRRVVVASQMARLDSGAVTLEKFDYWYFRRDLGKPGQEALVALKERIAGSHPGIAEKIGRMYVDRGERDSGAQLVLDPVVWPQDATLPPLRRDEIMRWLRDTHSETSLLPAHVFVVDLNGDGIDDYLVSKVDEGARFATVFASTENGWKQASVSIRETGDDTDMATSIERGEVRVVAPKINDLQVGGLRFEIYPR